MRASGSSEHAREVGGVEQGQTPGFELGAWGLGDAVERGCVERAEASLELAA